MKKRSEGVSKYAVVGLLLLVLSPVGYLLSIGPAIWLHEHGYMSDWVTQVLTVFYLPISWLAERSDLFGRALMQYIMWWTDLG
jgi:hypothetical protein